MDIKIMKYKKTISFAAGVAAAVLGKKILKSEKTREACVSGLAKGMTFSRDALEAIKNMKEEAEDICYEAKASIEDESKDEDNEDEA